MSKLVAPDGIMYVINDTGPDQDDLTERRPDLPPMKNLNQLLGWCGQAGRAPAPGGRQAQRSACACRGEATCAEAEPACRPRVRPDRRDRPDRVEHVPTPPAASTARLDPFGSRRAPAAQELPLASAAE